MSSKSGGSNVGANYNPDVILSEREDIAKKNINTVTQTGGPLRSLTGDIDPGAHPGIRKRLEALQTLFDARVKEIQRSRLQPGRQQTMITGRQ